MILLDPPYAGQILENALTRISEIDILEEHGIIIAESPADKVLSGRFGPSPACKTRRYGQIAHEFRQESQGKGVFAL